MDWNVWTQFRKLHGLTYSHAYYWEHAHRSHAVLNTETWATKILDDFEQFHALERLKGNS